MRGFNLFPLIQPGSKHTGNVFLSRFMSAQAWLSSSITLIFTGINDKNPSSSTRKEHRRTLPDTG